MTNLTEQWKKGELKLGEHYYYTTIFSPTVYIQNFTRDVISFQDFKETVAEVLEPVPTFEQWDKLNNACHELEKENTKLKELLKMCRDVLLVDEMNATAHYKKALQGLLAKINQVLGEE